MFSGSQEGQQKDAQKSSKGSVVSDQSQALVTWAGKEVTASTVSTALLAVGVTATVTPVLAVIVIVGHVIVQGAIKLVQKRFQVRADQRAHLEQLNLTGTKAADHFTIVINGVGKKGQYSAFVSPTDNEEYFPVNAELLAGVSKLISGSKKCNVRDMGGFTEEETAPFGIRISMPDVLALMRQSWVYERFCQTKCGTMTVVVLKARKGKVKLRVAWENQGSLDYTKVCRETWSIHL